MTTKKKIKKDNMYGDAKKGVSNLFVGCEFYCNYCLFSFQAQMKRQKPKFDKNGKWRGCQDCYDYKPHFHPERLNQSLPLTKGDEFIWLVRSGDIVFARPEWIAQILDVMRLEKNKNKTFFLQTKAPEVFFYMKYKLTIPDNLLLGITLETNRDKGYELISKAPSPSDRVNTILEGKINIDIITIEPIMDFDLNLFVKIIKSINPKRIYIGYNSSNSKKCRLTEPPLAKTMELIAKLEGLGIKVKTKLLRERWDK